MHPSLQAVLQDFNKKQASVQALLVEDAQAKKAAPKRSKSGSGATASRSSATAAAAQRSSKLTVYPSKKPSGDAAYNPALAPLSKQVKDIIQCLKEEGGPLSPDEILDKTRLDVEANPELLAALQRNDKVRRSALFGAQFHILRLGRCIMYHKVNYETARCPP